MPSNFPKLGVELIKKQTKIFVNPQTKGVLNWGIETEENCSPPVLGILNAQGF